MSFFKKLFSRKPPQSSTPANVPDSAPRVAPADASPTELAKPEARVMTVNELVSQLPRPQLPADRKRARRHHYLFDHVEFRGMVFYDPVEFISRMYSPTGEAWLRGFWDVVGDAVVEQGIGEKIPSDGLSVSRHDLHGTDYVIVSLPTPEAPLEAFFIAVVPPQAVEDNYRYLILEATMDSTPENPIGVLCEWFRDDQRRNLDWRMHADHATFEQAIATQIHDEVQRRQAGITPVAAKTWKPGEASEEVVASLGAPILGGNSQYRVQHCVFAFDVLPEIAPKMAGNWKDAFEKGLVDAMLQLFWQEAGRRCQEAGVPGDTPADNLHGEIVTVSGNPYILITLPEPIGAPEAYFLLLAAEASDATIYTLERPMARFEQEALFCTIHDGRHAIHSLVKEATPEGFLQTVEEFHKGIDGANPPNVLQHLLLYGEAHNFGRPDDEIKVEIQPNSEA